MARENRSAPSALDIHRDLSQHPEKYSFFQALRLLEEAIDGNPGFGRSLQPSQDPARLGQDPLLSFATATLQSHTPIERTTRWRLAVNFFGMFGPNGPLPLQMTEFAYDRLTNQDDPTMAAFIDVFHHRFLSFFYRAWADARPLSKTTQVNFSTYVSSLSGSAATEEGDKGHFDPVAKLYFSGLLANQSRSASGLKAMLEAHFEVNVRIEDFVPDWLDLPEHEHNALGAKRQTSQLGKSVMLGARVWSTQHKIRIVLLDLDYYQFLQFLPNGRILKALADAVSTYVGWHIDFDIQPVLRRSDVPAFKLGQSGHLGWTTWLREDHRLKDADDAILGRTTILAKAG